jgi:hypothetical protein
MANDKDIIKSVRVRKSHKLNDDFTDDIKVTISKSGLFNNKRKVVGESNNNSIWSAITYDMNGRYEHYDDKAFLDDFISTNAKLEGSEYVKDVTNRSQDTKKYIIAQDPWNDYYSTKYRSFSFDYYFLSNGATVVIKWLLEKWDEDRKQLMIYEEGGEQWSDDKGNELDVESIPDGKNIDGTPKVLQKKDIYKRVQIRDSREKGSNERLLFSWNSNKFYDEKDESADNKAASEKIDGKIPDKWILDKIIREWTSKVPSYDGKLLVCLNSDGTVVGGSYNPTSIEDPPNSDKYVKNDWMKLEWISPINPPAKLPEPVTEDNKPTGMSSSKIKLNVVLPPDFKVVVKQDTKDVKVYVGDPPKVVSPDGFVYREEEPVLDDEYSEENISADEFKYEVISDNQNLANAKETTEVVVVDTEKAESLKSAPGWIISNGGRNIKTAYELKIHHDTPVFEADVSNTGSKKWSKLPSGAYMYDMVLSREENGVKTNQPLVPSPVSGKVKFAGIYGDGNSAMEIKGDDGKLYKILHMDNYSVKTGDSVTRGQLIGRQSNIMPPTKINGGKDTVAPNVHLHIQFASKDVLISYIDSLNKNNFGTVA